MTKINNDYNDNVTIIPVITVITQVTITCFELVEHMMGCNLYPDQILTNGNAIKPYNNNNNNKTITKEFKNDMV